jgi:hypothetical protein
MNKIIKITVLTLFSSFFVGCGGKTEAQTNDKGKITVEAMNAQEQQAIDIVLALPEIQEIIDWAEVQSLEEIFVFSNGIDSIDGNAYYYIQVMREMETHYYSLYHFFVPIKPDGEIKILQVAWAWVEVEEDVIISLEEWRVKKKVEQIENNE